MFDVRLTTEFGNDFAARDEMIYAAAGRVSDWAGGGCGGGRCVRDHGWAVPTFDAARRLKYRLDQLPGVCVTIREASTAKVEC